MEIIFRTTNAGPYIEVNATFPRFFVFIAFFYRFDEQLPVLSVKKQISFIFLLTFILYSFRNL
jgi:hypothetical protein